MHEDCAATKTWVSQINKYFLNKIKKKNKQGDRWEKKKQCFLWQSKLDYQILSTYGMPLLVPGVENIIHFPLPCWA